MFDRSFLEHLRDELSKSGTDFGEVFLKRSTGTVITRENDDESVEALDDCGAGVRFRKGEKWSFSHITTGDPELISSFLKSVAAGKEPEKHGSMNISSKAEESLESAGDAAASLSSVASDVRERGASSFMGVLRRGSEEFSVITADGKIASDSRFRTAFYAQVLVRRDEKLAKGAECLMETSDLHDRPMKVLLERAAGESLRLSTIHLDAKVSPEGEMEVVLSGRAAGMAVHEAVGHLFEADCYNREEMKGFIGAKVAAGSFSLVEKGPDADFASIDDEGNVPSEQLLIGNGKATGLLSDLRRSLDLGIGVTGNARRENHRHEPLPRIWRLESPAGKGTDEELCSEINIGLYVKRFSDGKVNRAKGEAFFPVAEGYLVRDGRIAEPVTNSGVSLKIPAFLKKISATGSEREETRGLCVKRSQAVWTCESIPSLRLSKVVVRQADKQA